MSDVYCNNCGHRNPVGANFCSSCGAVLEVEPGEPTTITFFPTTPTDPVDEDVAVTLDDLDEDAAVLVIKTGPNAGARYVLDAEEVSVGRHPDSDVFLDDITVSRRHVCVVRSGESYVARDEGSLNGTYLNRERIEGSVPLSNGDELQVGKFKLFFFQGSGPS